MAIFPQGQSLVDARCNAGERRLLHQLKRCLGDDYLVWHDVPIGPRARQPDFVILSPRWGLLLLEVKDWKRSSFVAGSRDAVQLATARGRVTTAHPLRQARDYAMELVDLMQRDPALVRSDGPFAGKLLFPYGWGVVLSGLRAAELQGTEFHELFPEARTLLRDDLEDTVESTAFEKRLWGMFTLHFPHTLTLPQRDRIRWHLFPEIRLATTRPLDFEPGGAGVGVKLPDLLQVMDLQQEQVARTLGEGHRVIHGVAGSGKTMILVFRAQQLAAAARADRPILVLCFNRALAGRIDAILRGKGVDERVVVRTFHGWCEELVRTYQLHVPADRRASDYYPQLADTVCRAVETGFLPGGQYSALLIDEAHDFEAAWLQIAARMVDPVTRSLLVLYDDTQSIYQKKRRQRFSFTSVGIEASGRTSILRLNYRNTAEVMSLAVHCAESLLRPDAAPGGELPTVAPDSAGRHGPMPVLIEAQDGREEAELVVERIAAATEAGTPVAPRDIAILLPTRPQMAVFEAALGRRGIAFRSMSAGALRPADWVHDSIKLLTLHSSKGLEFGSVFVAGLQALPHPRGSVEEELRLLYVAMTRATHQLVLSAHGSSPMVDKVRDSLAQVTAAFAGG